MQGFLKRVRKFSRSQKGFTLVELLVVVAIIAILAAVLLPRLLGYTNNARVSRAQSDLASMRSVVEAYAANEGQGYYPSTSNIAAVLQNKGIAWGASNNPIKDPWGNPYHYKTAPDASGTADQHYMIVSDGPNKKAGDADDIYCTDGASPTQGTPPSQASDGGAWGTAVDSTTASNG